MIVKSLLTENNPFNSTAELIDWIESRNKEVTVQVKQIPFAEMDKWYSKEDGSLHHESGRFFLSLELTSRLIMGILIIGDSQL